MTVYSGEKVFFVEKRGVYAHGVMGVYETLGGARYCAEEVAKLEDGYHCFAVLEVAVNGEPEAESVCVATYVGKKVLIRAGPSRYEYEAIGVYAWEDGDHAA